MIADEKTKMRKNRVFDCRSGKSSSEFVILFVFCFLVDFIPLPSSEMMRLVLPSLAFRETRCFRSQNFSNPIGTQFATFWFDFRFFDRKWQVLCIRIVWHQFRQKFIWWMCPPHTPCPGSDQYYMFTWSFYLRWVISLVILTSIEFGLNARRACVKLASWSHTIECCILARFDGRKITNFWPNSISAKVNMRLRGRGSNWREKFEFVCRWE